MTNSRAIGTPAPMEGCGGYNRSSCVQATGSSSVVPLFEGAANQAQLTSAANPVVIADYGSSEGRNSLEPLTAAIGVLRRRIGPERAIWVVHTDLPSNDFTALFRMLCVRSKQLFTTRSRRFRVRDWQILLRPNSTVFECNPRMEFVGCAMAEQGTDPDS